MSGILDSVLSQVLPSELLSVGEVVGHIYRSHQLGVVVVKVVWSGKAELSSPHIGTPGQHRNFINHYRKQLSGISVQHIGMQLGLQSIFCYLQHLEPNNSLIAVSLL